MEYGGEQSRRGLKQPEQTVKQHLPHLRGAVRSKPHTSELNTKDFQHVSAQSAFTLKSETEANSRN